MNKLSENIANTFSVLSIEQKYSKNIFYDKLITFKYYIYVV